VKIDKKFAIAPDISPKDIHAEAKALDLEA